MKELFISAFLLGIVFAAPPGAVTAEAIRRGITKGFWAALLVELGSLIGDATWAIIALTGAAFLVQSEIIKIALATLGILLLFRLSFSALKDAWVRTELHNKRTSHRGAFGTGAFLSLTNPYAIAFWLGVGSVMVSFGVKTPKAVDFATFFTGFMLAAFFYCFIAALVITYGRRFITITLYRIINAICGTFLAYLAIKLLLSIIFTTNGKL